MGGVYNNLGMARKGAGNLPMAGAAFEQAIATQRKAHQLAPEVKYFRESLSKHYYNYAEVLRAQGRPADAAKVALDRRNLWSDDATRLLHSARELAAIGKELQSGETRQKYSSEASATLQMAVKAGLEKLPNLDAHPFDVLARESTVALSELNRPGSNAANNRGVNSKIQ